MTLKQKIFAGIASIFIVLVIDQLFLHYLFPRKKAAFLKSANEQVQENLRAHPVDDVVPAPVTTPSPALENRPAETLTDFATAAKLCLGGEWHDRSTIATDLEKTFGVQSKNKDIENFHLKTSNGEERRIHIIFEAGNKKQVRYFSVDNEGLPVPIPLSDEFRKLPADALIQKLEADGKIFMHQSKERWLLGNGSSFIVTFENDQPREFQLFGATKTLSCLEDSCQCN
jgi:hypothetical protein